MFAVIQQRVPLDTCFDYHRCIMTLLCCFLSADQLRHGLRRLCGDRAALCGSATAVWLLLLLLSLLW